MALKKIASKTDASYDDTVASLKRSYDGYHFTRNCPDIYNPFSLFSAFEKNETGNYWFATGTPTFLINVLRDSDTYLPNLLNTEADTTELADIDSQSNQHIIIAVLNSLIGFSTVL